MKQENYIYRNMPIPGGGYVTGFIFHEKDENVQYCRTDIGGTYRFNHREDRWESLINHVTMDDISETFPIALALDQNRPEVLYIACGINAEPHGKLAYSEDYGENFTYYEMPMHIHGNLNGRGTGYRLIQDEKDDNILWFASQENGLWKSSDRGRSWEKNEAFPEEYMTFVGQSKDGKCLFAAGAGVSTKKSGKMRGISLYISYDDGATFAPLWVPELGPVEGISLSGPVAQRYTMDDKYLYVTFSMTGPYAYVKELGYSCDGGDVIGGMVIRYPFHHGRLGQGENITPYNDFGENGKYKLTDEAGRELLSYGFSGVSVQPLRDGLVVMSTICKRDGDCIYRSFDYGDTWQCILYDLQIGKMDFRASYMKPEYNGNHNLIHWLSDIKCDPHREQVLWFNTGTGVFRTTNLLEDEVVFNDWCDGIEETVHLNLYSPTGGAVSCIDILGDLGGFAFEDPSKPCINSFADEKNNRYITCINADFSDVHPECVIVTPRGNWTGMTKGGLILSKDQCKTFKRLSMPWRLSDELDEALKKIEMPNVNSGWVAMSSDVKHIVWCIADGIDLPIGRVVYSADEGENFHFSIVYDPDGDEKISGGFKVFSDRVNENRFYGFGDHSDLYVSEDGGRSFREKTVLAVDENGQPCEWPVIDFSLIDCANKTEVRGEGGVSGSFYFVAAKNGLWKMKYDGGETIECMRLSKAGDTFYRLGLGLGREGGDYLTEPKALYTAATIDGQYGFYRTVDQGKTYVKLGDDKHMFGEINSMEGDCRVYGRFYIATGSRGALYGERSE